MVKIVCKKSKKSDKVYRVLVVNGVFVSFEDKIIDEVACTNGVSNIDLRNLAINEEIIIKGV